MNVTYHELKRLYPEVAFIVPTDSMRVLEPERFTGESDGIIYDEEYDEDYIIDEEKLPASPELELLKSLHEKS